MERYAALDKVKVDVKENFKTLIEESRCPKNYAMFEELEYNILRSSILNDGIRTDGRKVNEIRTITSEVSCCLVLMEVPYLPEVRLKSSHYYFR